MKEETKPIIKGYKVTDKDMKCRSSQYELNKVYKHTGKVSPCESGFHYCLIAADCFDYYRFDANNRVFEIIDHGQTVVEGNKSCTNAIEFIRELTWFEVLSIVNLGKDNTGLKNTGDWNTGNSNTGNRNTGNWNTGNRNTGDSNTGNWNTGAFCTDNDPKVLLFDKEVKGMTVRQWEQHDAYRIMAEYLNPNIWIWVSEMTAEEKEKYPTYKTTGGYLKSISMHEAWANMWGNLSEKNKQVFLTLPNFDAKKFKEITGLDV